MTMILPVLMGAIGAPAATGAAASGISAASLLSGVATVGGVLASIGAGNAQARSLDAQAAATRMEAENERVTSLQRSTAMKRELARILGENDVSYAAAGIDLGSGVAQEARGAAETRAAQEISIDRSMSDARRGMLRASAATYRRMARQARTTGFMNAAGTLAGAL